jgi:hypothetical protein
MQTQGPDRVEVEQVRSYLFAQTQKYSWDDLWPRVVGVRVALIEEIIGLSDEQADQLPGTDIEAEGDWGIAQIIRHVISDGYKTLSTIETLANRIEVSKQLGVELSGCEALSELVPFLLESSERLTTVRKWIPDQPDLKSTAPHMFFGELPCKAWFLFLRLHDTDHLNQIKALKNELHIS